MRVRVNDRTQLNHDGQVFEGGAFLELPEAEARRLVQHGIVTEAQTRAKAAPKPAPKAKRPTANKGRR